MQRLRRGLGPSLTAGGSAHRADIDGLRAIAIAPGVPFPAGVPGFGGGFVGVDVFFVISGFVIASSITRDLNAACFSILGFYERRARQILPALITVLLSTFLVALFTVPTVLFRPFAKSLFMPADLYLGPRPGICAVCRTIAKAWALGYVVQGEWEQTKGFRTYDFALRRTVQN